MRKQAWAPPLIWGLWVDLVEHSGATVYTVSFDTISQAPSFFEVEIEYMTNRRVEQVKTMGSGSYQIQGNDGAGTDRIRFKSHSTGQIIEVIY